MLIGILSDTHDRTEAMSAAVQLLHSRGAEYFIHCGDVGSPAVLDYLAGHKACFVYGNCDWDRLGLQRYAKSIEIDCFGAFGDLALDGKKLALIHGDDPALKRRLLSEQQHDYLLQGHTHVKQDLRVGKMRIINPGALHRANPKTVALLDTATDSLEFLEIT
jgi:putative phosphoesterase